ncbi:hypothetical protein [Paenibacillus qinlingensis]|uniref:hypothetical protein n=1 Tax=Paenibacillus qinlingensis TaxID=1837343 RepID=UPI0015633B7A|nr:hypothetical protein [Paenibacillus qinlingensis]NQX57522.1 hypothetical protein [Paenibacillus qinlingensis]
MINNKNTPIKHLFSIPEVLLKKDISCIFEARNDTDTEANLTRIWKALNSAGYQNVESLLNATRTDLMKVRDIGQARQTLLFDLLHRVSDKPEIVHYVSEELKRIKLEGIKKKLREMGMIN